VSDFQRDEERKEEVKANQEVPKEVMQLHYICCHEECAVAQVSAPQDFRCSSGLVRIKVKPQRPPALNEYKYTLKIVMSGNGNAPAATNSEHTHQRWTDMYKIVRYGHNLLEETGKVEVRETY